MSTRSRRALGLARAGALALLGLGVGTGCPPAAVEVHPAPAPTPRPDPTGFGPDAARFARVFSPRFDLHVPLPGAPAWAVTDKASRFLVLEHQATRSTLLVRLWHEDAAVKRAGCEAAARRLRALPERGRAVDHRELDVPPGFRTAVDVGFGTGGDDAALVGYVLAFGARGKRCFAYVLTTEATGTDAESVVGARLGSMVAGSLEQLELQSELEPF
ncbi:MAG: hypothetical protein IT373_28095 [Polyangiaceae bacterium]|nr:hypothetical protein [Polyangiaceae bacterium]